MKKKKRIFLYTSLSSFILFCVWTVLVCFIDVKAIGPSGSRVGFSAMNSFVHEFIGVNHMLYVLTDYFSLIVFAIVFGFAILGLCQWIKRKKLLSVDHDILALGVLYLAVMSFYLFFEYVVINYRPLLIEGALEASYPSSTTMLTLCVLPTAIIQFKERIKNKRLRYSLIALLSLFTAFMVAGRIISGVHWISDIIGGVLLSTALVSAYCFVFLICKLYSY